ncbi:MAG: hypothetical protein ACRCT1_17485 [Microcoleaceae cyanobacterium]
MAKIFGETSRNPISGEARSLSRYFVEKPGFWGSAIVSKSRSETELD